MKKLAIIVVLMALVSNSFGQDLDIKKNTISYEIGMWNRGLIGLSYHRNIPLNHFACVSVGGGVGAGLGWESGGWFGSIERNIYGIADISLNLGNEDVLFMVGFEPKYIDIYARSHYQGFAATPYLGVSTSLSDFTFQFRGGTLIYGDQFDKVLPSAGLSFGYSF